MTGSPITVLTAQEIRDLSVSQVVKFRPRPYIDPLGGTGRYSEEESNYAIPFYSFMAQFLVLAREYEYGGIYKTLVEYEEDWKRSAEILLYSKKVFDVIHPLKKGKEPYKPLEQAVLDETRVRCSELGNLRLLILKQIQRMEKQ